MDTSSIKNANDDERCSCVVLAKAGTSNVFPLSVQKLKLVVHLMHVSS